MAEQSSEFHTIAVEKVRRLWHLYIVNESPEQLEGAFGALPGDLLVIGTGRHEMYKSLNEFLSGMGGDQVEARNIRFELQDEWYEVQAVSEDVCVVYGSIWAREKVTPGKTVLVDMEGSRFTVVCRNTPHGVEICSIHHSMPYIDQGEDEYYPKSLSTLANEALRRTKALERRVELDHMTDLYNRVYMERHVSRAMRAGNGYFFVMDLDEFKQVNDTMGHLAGDKVIRQFARLLKHVFDAPAILGRMGGDEFAVWDQSIGSREEAEGRCAALAEGCRGLSARLGAAVSCSTGIVEGGLAGEDFTALYQRADRALYSVKAREKGGFSWGGPP